MQRTDFEALLKRLNGDGLQNLFPQPWFNDIFPDAAAMKGCDQGRVMHLEGDVAVHTGLVFDALTSVANSRLGRQPDFIERLAVITHDLRKPQTRVDHGDGRVTFPGHEALAASDVFHIAARLNLGAEETEKLDFLVRHHGDGWPHLTEDQRERLRASPYFQSLALVQEADHRSCLLPSGSHLPIYWGRMMESPLK